MGIKSWFRGRRPSTVTLAASCLVVSGFLLTALDWGWLALSAVGTFGPGILREMGLIHDRDEFQVRAARRAGYHAYLIGGLFAFLLVAWLRAGDRVLAEPGTLVEGVLMVTWFTWLLSSLFAYWGAHRTAKRILLIFGSVWLLFNILGGGGWTTTLMQSLLAVPFFLTAWLARRWPRIAGVLLLAAAALFFHFFGLIEVFSGDPSRLGRIAVIVLFIGPLVASGIGLLQSADRDEALQST